jgi:hypothetical protein
MKVIARKKFNRVNMAPGDTLTVHYKRTERLKDSTVVRVREKTLVTHALKEAHSFNTAIITELDQDEAAALGLKSAMGGIIGESLK